LDLEHRTLNIEQSLNNIQFPTSNPQTPAANNGSQDAFEKERGQPCPSGDRRRLLETRGQGCPRSFVEILERTLHREKVRP